MSKSLAWSFFDDFLNSSDHNEIEWQGKRVFGSFNREFSTPAVIDLTLLSFNPALSRHTLQLRSFYGTMISEDTAGSSFSIEAHSQNVGRPFRLELAPQKGKQSKPVLFRIYASWHSLNLNASFNPGETEHHGTGNSGWLVEQGARSDDFTLRFNSGSRPLDEVPRFEDIVVSLSIGQAARNK